MGWFRSLFAALRLNRKSKALPADVEASDDIVVRNGLSFDPPPDLISPAAKIEIEHQKHQHGWGGFRL